MRFSSVMIPRKSIATRMEIPEPDPELRDTENVPLGETIQDYFEGEVPHMCPTLDQRSGA
jgi:hypothetical protein